MCHSSPINRQFACGTPAEAGPEARSRLRATLLPRRRRRRLSSTRVRNTRCGVRIHKTIERVTHLIRLATVQFRARLPCGAAFRLSAPRARRLAYRTASDECRVPVSAVPRLLIVVGGEETTQQTADSRTVTPSLTSLHFSTTYIDLAHFKPCGRNHLCNLLAPPTEKSLNSHTRSP